MYLCVYRGDGGAWFLLIWIDFQVQVGTWTCSQSMDLTWLQVHVPAWTWKSIQKKWGPSLRQSFAILGTCKGQSLFYLGPPNLQAGAWKLCETTPCACLACWLFLRPNWCGGLIRSCMRDESYNLTQVPSHCRLSAFIKHWASGIPWSYHHCTLASAWPSP